MNQETIKCPLCEERIYSELGNGCRMCGMVVGLDENFCSNACEEKFGRINEKL